MKFKFVLAIVLLVLLPNFAAAEDVTLMWDLPEGDAEGYRLYQKTALPDDSYDFSDPVLTETYPDGNIPAGIDTVIVDVPGEPNAVLKYLWVMRSYRGPEHSANSNEVSYKVVNVTPASPTDLAGDYDKVTSVMSLSWTQPEDAYNIDRWVVYYRIAGEDFRELGTVSAGHELTLSAPFNIVPDGEVVDVYFSVVAFRRSGVFSPNSKELLVNIDRRGLEPPQNLRVLINFPVGG